MCVSLQFHKIKIKNNEVVKPQRKELSSNPVPASFSGEENQATYLLLIFFFSVLHFSRFSNTNYNRVITPRTDVEDHPD